MLAKNLIKLCGFKIKCMSFENIFKIGPIHFTISLSYFSPLCLVFYLSFGTLQYSNHINFVELMFEKLGMNLDAQSLRHIKIFCCQQQTLQLWYYVGKYCFFSFSFGIPLAIVEAWCTCECLRCYMTRKRGWHPKWAKECTSGWHFCLQLYPQNGRLLTFHPSSTSSSHGFSSELISSPEN